MIFFNILSQLFVSNVLSYILIYVHTFTVGVFSGKSIGINEPEDPDFRQVWRATKVGERMVYLQPSTL